MAPATERGERAAGLAVVPVAATLLFYVAPPSWQADRSFQFLPQVCAYIALAFWSRLNQSAIFRLGFTPADSSRMLLWGIGVGLALGSLNLAVILLIVPSLGYDYAFLADTPHARIPLWLMLPWFILSIAFMVELNFRGFLLGRLLALGLSAPLACLTGALLFAFDPFMMATFRHLHWIALWDGTIWGILRIKLDTLYVPIIAHAVEVIVLYSVMRSILV